MINSIEKLRIARELIALSLSQCILNESYKELFRELKFVISGGTVIYIKYNDFGEYGYQIMYSKKKGDYERFDNYDKEWDVKSKPHHFHSLAGIKHSPMIGDPKQDIPELIKYLKVKLKIL
ncbi:MAG: hypothetical protein INQ03_16535 [Candidatus Heimdallarchaeota archaeon]|nr:hypothetical protein [Candidatus Heimdallarchaeota archaeon]